MKRSTLIVLCFLCALSACKIAETMEPRGESLESEGARDRGRHLGSALPNGSATADPASTSAAAGGRPSLTP